MAAGQIPLQKAYRSHQRGSGRRIYAATCLSGDSGFAVEPPPWPGSARPKHCHALLLQVQTVLGRPLAPAAVWHGFQREAGWLESKELEYLRNALMVNARQQPWRQPMPAYLVRAQCELHPRCKKQGGATVVSRQTSVRGTAQPAVWQSRSNTPLSHCQDHRRSLQPAGVPAQLALKVTFSASGCTNSNRYSFCTGCSCS